MQVYTAIGAGIEANVDYSLRHCQLCGYNHLDTSPGPWPVITPELFPGPSDRAGHQANAQSCHEEKFTMGTINYNLPGQSTVPKQFSRVKIWRLYFRGSVRTQPPPTSRYNYSAIPFTNAWDPGLKFRNPRKLTRENFLRAWSFRGVAPCGVSPGTYLAVSPPPPCLSWL